MILLSVPFDSSPARRGPAPWRAVLRTAMVAAVVVSGGVGAGMLWQGWPAAIGRAVASAAVHGGFLAIGWTMAAGRFPVRSGPVFSSLAALLLASVASRVTAWGGVLYLVLPGVLLQASARDPALRGMGVALRTGLKPILVGLAAGVFLGAHLLVSASLTLGYRIRVADLGQYLTAAAYDVGASGLSAEWLFRGALFSHWWRRWEFWPAACASTALAVGRYLLDPALPATPEARAGAVLYMAILGFSSCALRATSGSLLPGYLATVMFFFAYRMLAQ